LARELQAGISPEADDPDLALLVKESETYRKWDITPKCDSHLGRQYHAID